MRIQHNVTAMNSYRNFNTNNSSLATNLEKLSSGYKINRAGDDAAGLAISEKMRAQISGLEGATKNAKDGISLVQTAEGALTEVHDMLNRMYTLAEQSANGTYEDGVDRAQLQKEVDQLRTEIDRIADSANFNGLKLLNGDLGAAKGSSVSIDSTGSVDFTDGISAEATQGEGAKSTFELSIDKPFNEGDTITLNFHIPDTATGSYKTESVTLTHQDTAITSTDPNLSFTGKTAKEQMESIVARLQNGTGTMSDGTTKLEDLFKAANFTASGVSADGKVTFTAVNEGENGIAKFDSLSTNNVDAGVVLANGTAAVVGTGGAAGNQGVTKLLTGDNHYVAGDKLKFEFTLMDGKTTSATVEITDDMVKSDDTATITNNIAEALKQTNFDDNAETTGIDESQYKVSDFFTITANKKLDLSANEAGSISVKVNDTLAAQLINQTDYALYDVKLAQSGSASYNTVDGIASAATQVVAGAAHDNVIAEANTAHTGGGTAGTKTVTLNQNLAEGDVFKLEGKLADGRAFSVELTATSAGSNDPANNKFMLGADETTTAENIKDVLNGNSKITVTNADGSTSTLKGSDVFNTTNGAIKGSTFKDVTAAGGVLTIASRNPSSWGVKGVTGDISFANISAVEAAASGAQTKDGVDATTATMSLTFNRDEMEYGTAITVSDANGNNGKTFELVEKATSELTQSGNIRVVVGDLANASDEDIAEAFKDAINGQLMTNYNAETDSAAADETYTEWAKQLGVSAGTGAVGASPNYATIDGNKVTLTSAATGSTAKAATAESTYGQKETVTIGYETNENGSLKLAAGDTLNINGTTYQFDTTTRNLQGDNKLIRVTDFSSRENIADAIKTAVEEDMGKKFAVEINDDYSVTISGKFDSETKTFNAPTAEQTLSCGGLTLQIGDTSEKFNKLNISIRDMHVKSIGSYESGDTDMALVEGKSIGDIDISSQEGAAEALDVIKSAINMVSDVRGTLGASQNRLEHTINNLGVMRENIQNAESAIRDTDVAEEMMTYTKNSILVQSAQAMLAQANQLPQGVLQLLG